MTTASKTDLRAAKTALRITSDVLSGKVPAMGLPSNIKVITNVDSVQRFPLTVAIPAALMIAIGVLLGMRGHRVAGVLVGGLGGFGMVAAAAAPELQQQIKKIQSEL